MANTKSDNNVHHTRSQPMGISGRQIRLAALPTAPGMARVFVKNVAAAWSIQGEAVEQAELVISELVTNAVKQTGRVVGAPTPRPTEPVAVVSVRVELHAAILRMAVWDSDTSAPVLQEPTDELEGGRGLFLVAAMTERWGHYFPATGGKVVWAEVVVA